MDVNKRIAYGESSFKGIIETNGYYIDKTKYISQLDKKSWYNLVQITAQVENFR